MGKIIFTISGKGGTGKTSVGAGVTSCLGILGHKTLLIDADSGLRNADIILGVSDKTVMHLGDVLLGRTPVGDALITHPEITSLSVLAAPSDESEFDVPALKGMLDAVTNEFEFIWIDGSAGLNEKILSVALLADSIIVVVTPDVVSMRDAARIAEILDGKKPATLVVNRVRPRLITSNSALYIDDIMDGTGLPLLGIVPEDERVIAATNKGIPLIALAQDGAAEAYRNIALRLLGERVQIGGMKVTNKAKRVFLQKLSSQS